MGPGYRNRSSIDNCKEQCRWNKQADSDPEWKLENGRRLFTVAAVLDGRNIAEGKAFNKKDASQIAAQVAVEKLGIVNADSIGEEQAGEKTEP